MRNNETFFRPGSGSVFENQNNDIYDDASRLKICVAEGVETQSIGSAG